MGSSIFQFLRTSTLVSKAPLLEHFRSSFKSKTITMHFSTVVATLALALGVAAGGAPAAVHQDNTKCEGGKTACCLNKSDVQADGILSGVLTKGLLHDVLGSSDQACAKWDLIENLNLLGFTKQGQNGQSCKSVTACCPEGEGSCNVH